MRIFLSKKDRVNLWFFENFGQINMSSTQEQRNELYKYTHAKYWNQVFMSVPDLVVNKWHLEYFGASEFARHMQKTQRERNELYEWNKAVEHLADNKLQKVVLNSGKESKYKIECDALTKEDIDCLTFLIRERFLFGKVIGVPTGGTRIAEALHQFRTDDPKHGIMLVDDVLTTGRSMEVMREQVSENGTYPVYGVVLFKRSLDHLNPDWVYPLFGLWPKTEGFKMLPYMRPHGSFYDDI